VGTSKLDISEDLLAWTPLTPTVFFVLLALADGPKHGYAIMKLSGTLSEGRVRMGPGALYTTIQRLLDAALIEETELEEGEDSRRRVYKLTGLGRSLLAFEVRRLESVLKIARGLKLGPAGGAG
jgi:DNA-binding PadR family transcriptional regulator